MEFFDYWLTFNSRFDKGDLSALTQLVGYKLLTIDNELRHPESFLLTDRELMTRTNIKSGQTIVEARRQLKNAGLIDFKAAKAKPTRYWFIKQDSSKISQSIKQDSSKNQANGLVSYTRARVIKTEDVKTDDDACARTTDDVAGATEPEADAYTQAIPLSSPEAEPKSGADAKADANDIQSEWAKAFGYDLRGNRALELEQLAAKDYERAQKAITRTKRQSAKSELNDEFAYFKVVYDELKPTAEAKPTPLAKDSTAEQLRKLDELMAKVTEK